MKTKIQLLTFLICVVSGLAVAAPPGTAFTYQGRLTDSGAPANGSYVFRFSLDNGNNTPVATPIVVSPVGVTNGLFTVTLDFGPGIFTNATRNLNIQVHTNDNGSSFVQLSPSQPILPTPYAIYAETADAAGIIGVVPAASLSGTYGNVMTVTNVNNTFAGNGAGLTGVDAATLGGLSSFSFWKLGGNSFTVPGTHFLGTTDNQPLELRANGQRVLRLDSSGSVPNLIGGHAANSIAPGLSGVTIAGGGDAARFNSVNSSWGTVSGGSGNTIAASASAGTISGGANNLVANNAGFSIINGGFGNIVSATHGAIGGGELNWIKPLADHSTIGGGYMNNIQAYAYSSTVGGGSGNTIESHGEYATIGGGEGNSIQDSAYFSTIGGGRFNIIQTNAAYSTIGGGFLNTIQTNADDSTIGGGDINTIQPNAQYSTISGGFLNTIQPNATYATIGGGSRNEIRTNAAYATISGGSLNTISSNSLHSTIGGGFANQASGIGVVVAGGTNNGVSGDFSVISGGYVNRNSGTVGFIGGGEFNVIETNLWGDTIVGGYKNYIGPQSRLQGSYSMGQSSMNVIGGGSGNTIQSITSVLGLGYGGNTIAGGEANTVEPNLGKTTIAGGAFNLVRSHFAAIAGGQFNTIQTNAEFATIPGGRSAVARSYGQQAYASGAFVSAGDGSAQASLYVLRGITTNATTAEIYLDGNASGSGSARMNLPVGAAWSYDILIVATTSGNLQVAGYQIKGMVVRNGLGTAIVGTPDKTTLNGSTLSWAADVSAGSADGTLRIAVTGAASTTIRWVASVRTTELIITHIFLG